MEDTKISLRGSVLVASTHAWL